MTGWSSSAQSVNAVTQGNDYRGTHTAYMQQGHTMQTLPQSCLAFEGKYTALRQLHTYVSCELDPSESSYKQWSPEQ